MGTNFKDISNRVLFVIGTFVVTILLYIMSPIHFVLFAIMLSYRECVIFSVKLCKSNWIPTSILSGAMGIDPLNLNKRIGIGLILELKKPFDLVGWTDRFEKYLDIDKRKELKCCLTRWMGLTFLTPCEHVSLVSILYVNSTADGDEIKRLSDTMHHEPFKPGQPLWQVTVFPNAPGTSVRINFRFHHGLTDGFSLMAIAKELGDPNPDTDRHFRETLSKISSRYSFQNRGWTSKLLIGLELFLVTPFYAVHSLLKSINVNPWTMAEETKATVEYEKPFDLKELKSIAGRLGTNVLTLFHAAITGAIRETMKKRETIPSDMAFLFVLPTLKGRQNVDKLTTETTLTVVSIPLSIPDRRERLVHIGDIYSRMKRPAWMLMCYLQSLYICLWATLLNSYKAPKYFCTGLWTNVVAIVGEDSTIMGSEVTKHAVRVGQHLSGNPIVFTTMSYKNVLMFRVTGYKSIFKNETGMRRFFDLVENELKIYSKMAER